MLHTLTKSIAYSKKLVVKIFSNRLVQSSIGTKHVFCYRVSNKGPVDQEAKSAVELFGICAILEILAEQGLRECDLPEIGNESVVSESLAAK